MGAHRRFRLGLILGAQGRDDARVIGLRAGHRLRAQQGAELHAKDRQTQAFDHLG